MACAIAGCAGGPRVAEVSDPPATRYAPEERIARASYDEPVLLLTPAEASPVQPTALTGGPSPLSLADVESMALANNPTIARERARADALRGEWLQVGLKPNPRVGYSGQEIGSEGSAGQQGAFVSQRFITGGKLQKRRDVVAYEIRQANERLAAQQQRVLTDVRAAFYDALVAQARVGVASRLEDSARQAAGTVTRLLDAQQATRVAQLQAEVEAESVAVERITAQGEAEAAWRRLAAMTGDASLAPAPLLGEASVPPAMASWETALARLLAESPEMSAAMAGVDRARAEVRRACAEGKPDLTMQVGLQRDDASHDTLTSVQISAPLTLYDRNQGGVRRAQSELTAARREADRVELDLAARLATVYRSLQNSRTSAERHAEELMPRAEETLRLTEKGYTAGESPYLDLLTAQRTFYRTNLNYLAAVRDAWRAYNQIEGLLLTGGLDSARE
ncbi:TolC family protein [Pseudobythopirellula maris]|uniref:TolC family protein n=1 Tax=Pseudobythopirellula maris TaxID=2527991 RepID=UPI0011B78BA9|nr:TolC family protein [Pseudobythopirellula maris]